MLSRSSKSNCAPEAEAEDRLADTGSESFAEALSYFPAGTADRTPRRRAAYLSLRERARGRRSTIPVIASLNGVTPGGWTGYARAIQDAGAAAIELNIYYLPGDADTSGRDVEQRQLDVLAASRTP